MIHGTIKIDSVYSYDLSTVEVTSLYFLLCLKAKYFSEGTRHSTEPLTNLDLESDHIHCVFPSLL